MVATRFAVAIHILLLMACGHLGGPATSLRLASSVNTNPVVVRRITGLLSRAGLIRVRRGPGGAMLARPAEQISLGDVWTAVNPGCPRPLLPIHLNPDQGCPVGAGIQALLSQAFTAAERAMHAELNQTTLSGLLTRLDVPSALSRCTQPVTTASIA
ncbi:MAG: Rrf2 family transcriptional regulator [Gemmatimonadaceae bacterium]|nr:Rrf2 family transcriptional regulator [Acetobacteraceae bacterium]